MVKRSLTDAAVKRLKPPDAGQIDVFDQGFPGLALRISYGGRKAWTFHYRIGGRLRRCTLGTYPALSLAEARESWRNARNEAQSGRDPATSRKRDTGVTDFESVLAEWLKRDQSDNRSHDAVKRLIDKDATSAWKHRSVLELGRRDVLDVIDSVVDRGSPITARRLHAHLHRLFRWAVGRGIITANPMADLPKPGSETKRDRVLTDHELKAVWQAAAKLGWPFGAAVQLLILTGARRQEIGGLHWSEVVIVAEDHSVELRGERTKTGEPHTIPLSKPAVTIIEALPRVAKSGRDQGSTGLSDLVFTTNGDTPISGWTKAKKELPSFDPPWTIHDLRRTVATGLQRLGFSLQVIEAVLGHSSGSRSGVVGVYQRHSFDAEKRVALEAWAEHVALITIGNAAK
ncbi:MAG: tyrosine-type recombinase/integrase [Methyloceanibacter sp.]|uniref:tyrosine-type recombinase/integrase n=1 Tax=Methyloceanibacter sp. TaxID=1965321 RepID=UPI003D9B704E